MTAAQANPFVGLRPFEANDSVLFFGRQQQAAELLRRLHDVRFVSVVGSSGCGKSSLVRAGLIPMLQAGFLVADRDVWHIGSMKPGDAPIENLATALLANGQHDGRTEVQAFAHDIREGGVQAIIDRTATLLSGEDSNFLLLVDQFEEIFRFDLYGRKVSDGEGASDFVSIMLDLATQHDVPLYVIMTMRSDFMGDCDRFLGLPEAMNRGQYLVPRLSRQQRREAIEGPVRLFGEEMAPRLTDRLLNESIDTRDDLPVLQHALMRTWDKWKANGGGPLDVGHYDAIGTMHEALSRDAEAALKGMDERQLLLTRRLFQSLTTVDSGNRRIRRPAKLGDVSARTGASGEEIWPLVQRFRDDSRSFLVVSSEHVSENPLIDISHESLIRQWERLGTWVDEEAESIRTYRRLAETAALRKQGRAGLYRDPDLQVALDWQAQESPNEGWATSLHAGFADAMDFLQQSRAVRDRDLAEGEFGRRWRVPRLGIAALVLALFFFNLGFDSWKQFWDGVSFQTQVVVEQLSDPSSFIARWLPREVTSTSDKGTSTSGSDRVKAYGQAIGEMIRVGAHVLLFLGLAYAGKRAYRRYVFRATLQPRTERTKHTHRRDSKMQKARRILEGTAKWASIGLGTMIIGTCSLAGASSGGFGFVGLFLIGVVIALALVGWVFAIARLNADVKAIREELARKEESVPEPRA